MNFDDEYVEIDIPKNILRQVFEIKSEFLPSKTRLRYRKEHEMAFLFICPRSPKL